MDRELLDLLWWHPSMVAHPGASCIACITRPPAAGRGHSTPPPDGATPPPVTRSHPHATEDKQRLRS